jgi:hypothetical protein
MEDRAQVKTAKDPIAGPEEVRQAIGSLTTAELVKLQRLVEGSAYRLRRRVPGADGKEILDESVLRVLDGRRQWQPRNVDFVGLLVGIIRSIESEWRERAKRPETPVLETDLPDKSPDGDQMPNAIQQAADPHHSVERQFIESEAISQEELFEQIEELLSDDSLAALIFSERRRGTKGPEIMKASDLTRKEYDTAVRRMDRAIQKRWPEGMPHVR